MILISAGSGSTSSGSRCVLGTKRRFSNALRSAAAWAGVTSDRPSMPAWSRSSNASAMSTSIRGRVGNHQHTFSVSLTTLLRSMSKFSHDSPGRTEVLLRRHLFMEDGSSATGVIPIHLRDAQASNNRSTTPKSSRSSKRTCAVRHSANRSKVAASGCCSWAQRSRSAR